VVVLVAGALFAPLEWWFAPTLGHPRKERFTDALHFLINPVINAVSGIVAVVAVLLLLDALGWESVLFETQSFIRDQPGWLQFALATLLAAVLGYWAHRAFHGSSLLWRFHAVHHSSERVDWLSTHRQHPVEVAIVAALTLVPVFLLGLGDAALIGFVFFRKLHVVFSHAHLNWSLGPLGWLVVSPRFHHWHHEPDAQCNFAGLFPFLDKLFGTYRGKDSLPTQVGCRTHVHRGYLCHIVHPLKSSPSECLVCSRPDPC